MRHSKLPLSLLLNRLRDMLAVCLMVVAAPILILVLALTLGLLAMVLLAVALAQALSGQEIKPSSVFRSMSGTSYREW